MPRRRRPDAGPDPVPDHLRPGSPLCIAEPQEWKRQRLTWFDLNPVEHRAAGITAVEWLRETRESIGQTVVR